GVIQRGLELVHGVRAEGIAHLGPVERDAHRAQVTVRAVRPSADRPVVGDVGEGEAVDGPPAVGIEQFTDAGGGHGTTVGRSSSNPNTGRTAAERTAGTVVIGRRPAGREGQSCTSATSSSPGPPPAPWPWAPRWSCSPLRPLPPRRYRSPRRS